MAGLNSSLECGSLITTIDVPINKYIIRRKVKNANLNPTLVELDYTVDLNSYVDCSARNNIEYTYTVSPLFEDENNRWEGLGLEGDGIVSFYGWILSSSESATPTTQYVFDMENESSEIQVITDLHKYENYTQYPSFRSGQRNYREGTLKTIPYSFNSLTNEYTIDVDLLDALEAFINDGNVKILRNTASEIWYVVTSEFSYKYYDNIPDQPYKISYKFSQVQPPV
jgi:hypothetical protein